jgi:hypothetical protein
MGQYVCAVVVPACVRPLWCRTGQARLLMERCDILGVIPVGQQDKSCSCFLPAFRRQAPLAGSSCLKSGYF